MPQIQLLAIEFIDIFSFFIALFGMMSVFLAITISILNSWEGQIRSFSKSSKLLLGISQFLLFFMITSVIFNPETPEFNMFLWGVTDFLVITTLVLNFTRGNSKIFSFMYSISSGLITVAICDFFISSVTIPINDIIISLSFITMIFIPLLQNIIFIKESSKTSSDKEETPTMLEIIRGKKVDKTLWMVNHGFSLYSFSILFYFLGILMFNSLVFEFKILRVIGEILRTVSIILVLTSIGWNEKTTMKLDQIISKIKTENRELLTVAYTTAFDERDNALPKTKKFLAYEILKIIEDSEIQNTIINILLNEIKNQIGILDKSQEAYFSYVE
ncbi:MAG: hypothetical protein ACTSUV_06745 [Candidatus Ranarchaeia archaeon]